MVDFGCLLKKHKDWVSNRDARIANFHVYKCNAFLFYNTRSPQSLNRSRYFVATSTASSTLSAFVPFPMLVGAFPPALPPTTLEISLAHSFADAPCLLASCRFLADHVVFRSGSEWIGHTSET